MEDRLKVTDPAGLALAAAVVTVDNHSQSATTGADGRYVLRVARSGEREVVTVRVNPANFTDYLQTR